MFPTSKSIIILDSNWSFDNSVIEPWKVGVALQSSLGQVVIKAEESHVVAARLSAYHLQDGLLYWIWLLTGLSW